MRRTTVLVSVLLLGLTATLISRSPQADARLKEAAKLGFDSACLPRRVAHGNRRLSAPEGLVLEEIGHIADLVARFAPGTATRDDS